MSDRDAATGDSPDLISSLIEISKAITRERNLDKLLGLVLEKSRLVTGADAGSIYVVEGESEDVLSRALHFKLSQNDSVDFRSSESVMPVSNRSMAGTAVILQKPINVPDVYELDENVSFEFDRSFDRRFGYRCRSMLTVPLISAEDEVIGVVQLINKKRNPARKLKTEEDFEREVIPFDERSQELASTLAAQAGIALENALLYDEIQKIFAGFVRASVQAIEQRDERRAVLPMAGFEQHGNRAPMPQRIEQDHLGQQSPIHEAGSTRQLRQFFDAGRRMEIVFAHEAPDCADLP
jgi:GAF domain-containing protein